MRHVKLAFRTLFKTPFVTAVAVLSLALGIGANAAIYSLFDQMLLQPLPVPDPGELIQLTAPGPNPGSQSCNQAGDCDEVFTYPMFRDLEREQKVLTGLAAHRLFNASFSVKNEPHTGDGVFVSGSYFPTLGIRPALGRLLGPADDEPVAGNYVAVLSYAYWQGHFGGDPGVLGQTFIINGKSMQVVGVAPQGFEGTTLGSRPLVYVPLTMSETLGSFGRYENRRVYWLYLFGRLKPGVTLDQASAALNGIYTPILADVEAPLQKGMSDATLARFKAKKVGVNPGAHGQSSVHKEARTPLLLLFSVTGIVLLIACANIANLLLARGAGRATEMGVRLALGAGRRQLVLQLLTEAVMLALMGGTASLLVARWTLDGIASLVPPEAASSLIFTLQPSVLLFAGLLSVATGLLFGLFPAFHNTRADLITAIRAGAGQILGHRGAARFRAVLVTVQIALASALLICAGLFLKSLVNVTRTDLGVKLDQVVTFSIAPSRAGYDSLRAGQLYARVQESLEAIPGVNAVSASLVPLLAGSNWGTDVHVQGFPEGPDVDNNSRYNEVGEGYFALFGTPVVAGREFTLQDLQGGHKVAVVNQAFAKKFNLGQDAVGKYMSDRGPDSLDIEIVGLVQDAKYSQVKDEVPPLFFRPWRQDTDVGHLYYYIRSNLPGDQLLRAIPPVLKAIDPSVPIEDLKTMPQQVRENISLDRTISILSAAFAALATLLAAVGLYGVLAYTVAQRTREIGVRMALGADAGRVRALVVRQVMVMLVIGGLTGAVAALGAGRAAQSLLYGLQGHDPVVFGLSLAMLAVVALAAAYLPARRASQVDPVQALRYE